VLPETRTLLAARSFAARAARSHREAVAFVLARALNPGSPATEVNMQTRSAAGSATDAVDPKYLATDSATDAVDPKYLKATAIYDLASPEVSGLAAKLRAAYSDDRSFIQAAHAHLSDVNMATVYSIDDEQPASVTLRENKGACAQRMAALEAIARAAGIGTRVRALWLAKQFWFRRLPLLRWVLPDALLYTWPQFLIEGSWVDFDELYEPMDSLAADAKYAFSNAGESIFSAVQCQPVDFLGKSRRCSRPEMDLSKIVTKDAGIYATREDLFAAEGGKPNRAGQWLFNLLYGGRPIRRTGD
jgi:hypothetical protein